LRDSQLQLHLQQFRNIFSQNWNIYTLEDGLYIGRKWLGNIVQIFKKWFYVFKLEGVMLTEFL
jgi:hypothetical protein